MMGKPDSQLQPSDYPKCPSCGTDSLQPRPGYFRAWYWCLNCAAYQTDP